MPEYCSTDNIKNRLTTAGVEFAANRDGGGAASSTEIAAYITSGIQEAGTKIDAALVGQALPSSARAQTAAGTVDYLKFLCVDLASFYAATKGGDDAPESIKAAFDRAWGELENIRRRFQIVPGLTYDIPVNGSQSRGVLVRNVY